MKKIFLLLSILVNTICIAKTIYVSDFGAVPDGKTDSTPAFKKAFIEAKKYGSGVTIQLDKGRYMLTSQLPQDTDKGQKTSNLEGKDKEEYELYKQCRKFNVPPCIEIEDANGITVLGQGTETEIIINVPLASAFQITRCRNITFKDLVIDYDPIPFTQGTITAVNIEAGTFDYKIDSGFPALSEYWFNKCDSKWGIPFDKERRFRMNGESAVFSDSWDDLGDSTWRMHMHYKNQAGNIKTGDRFVHIARQGTAVIFFSQSADIDIDNVHIYASPGTATIFFQCYGNIHVNRMQVKPRPGSGRIFSLNGDVVHCQSPRKGPLIENCIFEGMSDDGMNFYTIPSVITEILAPDKVVVKCDHPYTVIKGDHVQIIEPSTGTIKVADVEVTSVEGNVITFAKGIEGLKAGKNHVEADTIFNLSACGSGFIVRNNILGGFRGRGVVARAHHGLIENNLIHDTSGQGIAISNEPDWPEGPIPADITIRNNTVIGVNRDLGQQQCGAIQVSAFKLRFKSSDKPQLQKVVIENNKIIDSPGSAILLQGVCDANVTNNLVQLTANDRPIEEYYGIKLDSCKDIKIENFTIADQWGRVNSAVFMDGTPKESVSIKNINADLNKKGQLIREK
jgi:hypothetical protein